eukprot:499399_1
MGSSGSTGCGCNGCPAKSEINSSLLKQHRTNEIMLSTETKESLHNINKEYKCLIFGYLKEQEHIFHIIVPDGIGRIIIQYFMKLYIKRKYNNTATQIEILISEYARTQSLLLCSKTDKIRKDGNVKQYGFLKYLQNNLSDNVVAQLFSKFPDKSKGLGLSGSRFVSLLTLVVIIYRVKLHQLRTGTKEKPSLNVEQIKSSVEHLAVWCIRMYGQKTNRKKQVIVYDDRGNQIRNTYHVYKFRLTQTTFSQNINQWIKNYVDKEGSYDTVIPKLYFL